MESTTDRGVLEAKLLPELQQIAQTIGVEGAQKLRKAGLIDAIVAKSGSGSAGESPAEAAPGTNEDHPKPSYIRPIERLDLAPIDSRTYFQSMLRPRTMGLEVTYRFNL